MEASRLLRAALASRLSIYFITPSRIPPHMVPDRGWVGSTQGRIPFSAPRGSSCSSDAIGLAVDSPR